MSGTLTLSSNIRKPLIGVLGLLLALLVIACGSWWLACSLSTRMLRAQGAQATADLDQELTRLRFFPRVLAGDPRLEAALSRGLPSDILAANTALDRITRQSGAAFSFLMDTAGFTVAASNFDQPSSFIGKNYGFRPYFRRAMDEGAGTFYAVGATTGQPGYFLAQSMVDDTGAQQGVVVVKLDLEDFIQRYRTTQKGLVVSDDLGVVILSTEPAILYAPLVPLSPDAQALSREQRRYALNAQTQPRKNGPWLAMGARVFLSVQTESEVEAWSLLALHRRGDVLNRAGGLLAMGGAGLLIAVLGGLLVRLQLQYSSVLRRKVAEKSRQLQAAQRQVIADENLAFIGRMSAAISHEINQPLASLRFNLATLSKLHDQDEDVQSIVAQSKNTASRIARVIETLRLFARRKEVVSGKLDLSAVARTAQRVMSEERPRASEAIRTELPSGATMVRANDVLMQQVTINLLTNALDATKALENPDIELRIETEAAHVVLSVTDNGPGVEASIQGDLFTPFASAKPMYKGLGLGLSLARSIVEDAGGTLTYTPQEAPFKSRFMVRLPAHDD